jgi:hypothetical protein
MALMVAPREACANMERLSTEGCEGEFGFYEAVDHTRSRLPHDEKQSTVRSFMVHHQGMSFLAFVHLMCERPMQRRFVGCPVLKAADLLLHERVPKTAANVFASDPELSESVHMRVDSDVVMRMFTNPAPRIPEVHLLSNGRFHVVISSAGGGYSRWNDLAITRWREDSTRDCWGTFIYLRDVESGGVWSVAHHPVGRKLDGYEAIFTQGRAEFRHRLSELETHTEVCVSPEDDVELRRVTLVNRAAQDRVIELTSYAEVVLAPPAADAAHPAFSNLFVQTEFIRESSAILCTRRARSHGETPPWLLHIMHASGGAEWTISFETDISKFIGRGLSIAKPAALSNNGPL